MSNDFDQWEVSYIENAAAQFAACKRSISAAAYEMGRILIDLKASVRHGQFLCALQHTGIGISVRHAQNLMKLAESKNGAALASLPLSTALRILRLPESEQLPFLQEHEDLTHQDPDKFNAALNVRFQKKQLPYHDSAHTTVQDQTPSYDWYSWALGALMIPPSDSLPCFQEIERHFALLSEVVSLVFDDRESIDALVLLQNARALVLEGRA